MRENVLEDKPALLTQQSEDLSWLEKRLLQNGIQLQLFVAHCIAGGCSLAAMFLFMYAGLHLAPAILIVFAILISGGAGLFFTCNIQYAIYRIESSINAIIHGHPITIPVFSWPFINLFACLQQLDRRVQAFIQGEKAAAEIRRNYLQRASDSATLTERQRIARDLHDSIKQQLFSISISAATARAFWEKDRSRASTAVADIQRVVKEAQVEMQALLQQLGSAPLENTRLADALRIQADALKYRSELEMEVNIGEIPHPEVLPEKTHETIFRLVQEAFSNIARHARARSAILTLRQTEKYLHLIIRDDGNGFDQNHAHVGMGLTNMRERVAAINGTIEMHSAPEQGTMLHVVIPLLHMQGPDENQIRIEQEIKQVIDRGTRGLQAGNTAQNIALFLIVVSQIWAQVPFELVIIGMLVACYGMPAVYLSRRKLILLRGKDDSAVLDLQQKEVKLWGRLSVSFLLGDSIFAIRIQSLQFPLGWLLLFLVVLTLLLFIYYQWNYHRTQAIVYRFMTPIDIREAVAEQRRRVRTSVSMLFVIVLIGMLSPGNILLAANRTSQTKWSFALLVLFIVAMLLSLFSQSVMLWQRKRALKRKVEQTSIHKGVLDDCQN